MPTCNAKDPVEQPDTRDRAPNHVHPRTNTAQRDSRSHTQPIGEFRLIGGGHPEAEPDIIAKAYTALYDERQAAELHYVAYDA